MLDLGTHLVATQALMLFGQPAADGSREVLRERDGEGSNDANSPFACITSQASLSRCRAPPACRPSARPPHVSICAAPAETSGSGDWIRRRMRSAKPRRKDHGQQLGPGIERCTGEHLSVDVDGGAVTRPVPSATGDYRLFLCGRSRCSTGKLNRWLRCRLRKPGGLHGVLEWAKQSSEQHRDVECDWSGEAA